VLFGETQNIIVEPRVARLHAESPAAEDHDLTQGWHSSIQELPVNFPPVSDGEEVDFAPGHVEAVNHPRGADAPAIAAAARQTVMRKILQPSSHFVNFRLDASLGFGGQFQKTSSKLE
jgi:hypothetical protein